MRRNRNIRRPPIHNLIQHNFTPRVLVLRRLSAQLRPERILFSKALLECKPGELGLERSLGAAPITRMCADAFAQEFFDNGLERNREREIRKRQARSIYTARQRTRVVSLRRRNFLVTQQARPEGVDAQRLSYSSRRELRIRPRDGRVAVALRPEAVPGRRAEERFGRVVEAFAVASEEEERVVLIAWGLVVECRDVVR
jgi:hypothetical protein